MDSHSSMKNNSASLSAILWLGGSLFVIGAFLIGGLVAQTPAGSTISDFISHLFALDSVQLMWYITRSAGLTAYLVMWLSVAWGLAVSSKIFDRLLHRSFTYDFHQYLSLLAIGFIVLHLGSLMFDRYLPYSLPQLLIPALSPYRPVWVGVGVIAFYLTLLVTVTFYMRSKIGMKTFRAIHIFSLLAYLGVTVHGFMSGTDSSLPAVQLMYLGSFFTVVFLMTYWLLTRQPKRVQRRA